MTALASMEPQLPESDFQEALAALLGKDAPNLSPLIGRLKEEWRADHDRWQYRDPCARRYVYIRADGVYLQARMEDDAASHAGRHRRAAGRQEGTGRLSGWHAPLIAQSIRPHFFKLRQSVHPA